MMLQHQQSPQLPAACRFVQRRKKFLQTLRGEEFSALLLLHPRHLRERTFAYLVDQRVMSEKVVQHFMNWKSST